jgi:putative CocE/NonD family hydrolase
VASSDLYSQAAFPGGAFRKSMVEGWLGEHATQEVLEDWKAYPTYGERWEQFNSEIRVYGMKYPGFHLGGWYDIFSQGTINAFIERQHNGGPGSAGNQKLVMGPWIHAGFFIRRQGELVYPPRSLYILRYFSDAKVFFDYWLKEIDNGLMDRPAVTYYVMGDVDDLRAPGNEWREADDWPVPHINLTLFLSSEGLSTEPGSDSSHGYSYDPDDPVPTVGGANLVLKAGSMDQRSVEERDDVLVFTTEPLEVPVEVTGRIYVKLYASSSCRDTDFMAKLTDVYPDGRSMLVLDGAVQARYRESNEYEVLMEPGTVYEFTIDLWSTSIVFNRGHRIRLAITSSNYPRFEKNPNTGAPFAEGNETLVADNIIYIGASHPSGIVLPLAGPDTDGDGLYDYIDPDPSVPVAEAGMVSIIAILIITYGLSSWGKIHKPSRRAQLE